MFKVGDIVRIYAPQAGHIKYHVCLCVGDILKAYKFLYLNSDPNYDDVFEVECSRIPCLPVSETGKSVFAFTFIPRYTEQQLRLWKAAKLGELDPALAKEVYDFAVKTRVMSREEKKFVLAALLQICGT